VLTAPQPLSLIVRDDFTHPLSPVSWWPAQVGIDRVVLMVILMITAKPRQYRSHLSPIVRKESSLLGITGSTTWRHGWC
jgi:hypothetical protein